MLFLIIFIIAALPSGGLLIQGCTDNGGLKHTEVNEYPTLKFGNQESTGIDFCETNPNVYVRVSSDGWGQSNFNIRSSLDEGKNWSEIHSPGTTGKVILSATGENNILFSLTSESMNLQYTVDGVTRHNSTDMPVTTFPPPPPIFGIITTNLLLPIRLMAISFTVLQRIYYMSV